MFLVFDIGGSQTRIGISSDGQSISNHQIFPSLQNPGDLLPKVKQFVGNTTLTAIAGGIPKWLTYPVADALSTTFACPVYLANDAALVGLGEAIAGAGKNYSIVAYITVSTGVGGARIVNGHIDSSASGFEPGHQIITDSLNTLENLVSGSAIQAKFGVHPKQIAGTADWQILEHHLAIGLTNTILHWSPNILILGGGMARDISLDNLRLEISKLLISSFPVPLLTKFQLGDTAGLIGSLVYLHQQQSSVVPA